MMTGTLIRNVETNTWQKMMMYYDYQGKLIQDFHFTNRGNLTRKDHQLRFNGELLKTRIEKKNGSTVLSTKIFTYEYDHLGRKSKFKHSLGGNEKTIAKYEYDQIGRMSQKLLIPLYQTGTIIGGPWTNPYIWENQNIPNQNDNVTINAGHTVTIAAGTIANAANLTIKNGGKLQNFGKLNLGGLNGKINNAPSLADPGYIGSVHSSRYQYHIRGGLQGINLDANNNLTNDLFSYKLDYESGTNGYFDGNISKQSWKSNIDSKERSFTYTYDGASRLKSGAYKSDIVGEDYSLNNVSYDANGNITNLLRNGLKSDNTFGLIDNLNYTYNPNSNKILKVDDASNETASFKDAVGNDYDYWTDGSLRKDNNKDITQIDYNYLKLPKQITLTGGRWIKYEYDASGAKLKKTLSTGKVTDYEEDEIYVNGILYQTSHDEGRIVDGIYEYNITDHLGNLRVAFKDKGGVPEITQSIFYDPWGLSMKGMQFTKNPTNFNKYQFLSRETQIETGLVDLVNRQYDPPTGRFLSQDKIIEGQENLSLYQYGWNNPILKPDPDGNCPKCKEFLTAFWGGIKDGAKSTASFVKSLGTSQGRENAAVGSLQFFEMFAPYVETPTETQEHQNQFYGGIANYAQSIPNKSGKDLAHDAGYATEKIVEVVVISKGANLVKGAAIGATSKFLSAESFTTLSETGTINPYSIKFSQGSISGTFKNGGGVGELASGLKDGTISPSSVPAIRIVVKDGQVFTLDNRRLQAFQQAGVAIPYQKLESIPQGEMFKFKDIINGKADGTSIKVRGQ
jgi:RHS repeat-associated protein